MPIPEHLRLLECRHGVMLFNVNHGMLSKCLETYGEVCENEARVFAQVLKPGMLAVDVGASFGVLTLPMARAVGAEGLVAAFEPQRPSYQTLCANMALNGVYNVHSRCVALGRSKGLIKVPRLDQLKEGKFGTLALGHWDTGESVPLDMLDNFTFPRCDLIKIDVEGMEADVLAGAHKTINRFRPIIYLENDRFHKSGTLIRALWDLEYDCYWHLPPYVTFPNFRGAKENLYPGMVAVNMMCAPRERPYKMLQMTKVESVDDRPKSLGLGG